MNNCMNNNQEKGELEETDKRETKGDYSTIFFKKQHVEREEEI